MLKKGDNVPKGIILPDQDGKLIKLDDFKGQKLVIYSYPKDNTPGCTIEAKKFRDSIEEYDKKGIKIIGISADSVDSHKKFAEKHNLNFTLLSDKEEKKALKAFGALDGDKGWPKRRTWLIDENWKIEKVYEKVSASKHDKEVREYYGLVPQED